MSYRELLIKQIRDLEEKIARDSADKEELQRQLNKLKISEFEEDMRESTDQRLLKG